LGKVVKVNKGQNFGGSKSLKQWSVWHNLHSWCHSCSTLPGYLLTLWCHQD